MSSLEQTPSEDKTYSNNPKPIPGLRSLDASFVLDIQNERLINPKPPSVQLEFLSAILSVVALCEDGSLSDCAWSLELLGF